MKHFKSIDVRLKNQKTVTIRVASTLDAVNLLKTIKSYVGESPYIPKLQEEFRLTLEEAKKWIRSLDEQANSLLLVAVYENEIIANVDLTGNQRKVMKHTAVIGMGMAKEWQNVGLGTALLFAIIEWAKKNPILELIWLQVYRDNQLGRNLYDKMGFIQNGIIKGFFKQDGQYFDNLTMSMKVG
jgi:RimJ/RimL family protein N-acetyltransferase